MANDDVYENASPPLLATQRSPAPPPPPPPPAGVNPWRLIKSSPGQMARLLFWPQTIYLKHV